MKIKIKRMDARGRIRIPKEIMKQTNLHDGDKVSIKIIDNEFIRLEKA